VKARGRTPILPPRDGEAFDFCYINGSVAWENTKKLTIRF
jgi:hypothetical protein